MFRTEIIRLQELSEPEKSQITNLIFTMFSIKDHPNVDFHYVISQANEIIGYCAIKIRVINIDNVGIIVNLLGLFCITKLYQRIGLGSKLLTFVKHDISSINNYGIILNCGNDIQQFYHNNGFFKVSDNAKYMRNDIVVIDNDPVLYFGDQIKANKELDIYLGEDF